MEDLEYRVTQLENQVIELQKLFNHIHDAPDLRTRTSEPQYPVESHMAEEYRHFKETHRVIGDN